MKKFNYNIVVFVVAFLLIGCGFCQNYMRAVVLSVKELVSVTADGRPVKAVNQFTTNVDSFSAKKLSYYRDLKNIYSLKENLFNTHVVTSGSKVIVKSNTGSLVQPQIRVGDAALDKTVEEIQKLCNRTQKAHAEFLYVAAPPKGYGFSLPANVTDYKTSNVDRFLEKMTEAQIPMLDLTGALVAEGLYGEDVFFDTDHHWTPKSGFWANGKICETLQQRYGFSYNRDYVDLSNYDIQTYPNHFLGSYGKKTGLWFANMSADDFDMITPKFHTDLTEVQPLKNQIRTGGFSETVLHMNYVQKRDYYGKNPYAAYSGGDLRLQTITNNLNKEGKKVLLIRDSFACVVAPFLSLQTAELHVADVRNGSFLKGDKINVYQYIDEIQPDYVIVLYMGVPLSSGIVDFH